MSFGLLCQLSVLFAGVWVLRKFDVQIFQVQVSYILWRTMNLDARPCKRDLLLHGFANNALLCIMHFSVNQGFANVEVLFLIAYFTGPLTLKLE